jgi:hypothetical protein
MPDLDDRFRALDAATAPDLWTDISTREPGRPEPRRSWASAVVILASFAVAVASIAWLAVALGGRTDHPPGPAGSETTSPSSISRPPPSPVPASVSGLATDGSVRCTASVDSVSVGPGSTAIVHFAVENLSSEDVQIGAVSQVLVDDASGHQVYDSFLAGGPRFGGVQRAEDLAPGETLDLPVARVPIRWAGPLTLHPVCPVPQGDPADNLQLLPLGLQVTNPGPASDPADAVSRALDAFGPLFAHCRPAPDAGPVTGQIGPLPGIDAPALDARCEAVVEGKPGFDVVTITFVSPPDAAVPEVPDPVYDIRLPREPGSIEAWRAMVVVTVDGSFVVEPPQYAFSDAALATIDVGFEEGRWTEDGESPCVSGGQGGFGGGLVLFRPGDCVGP